MTNNDDISKSNGAIEALLECVDAGELDSILVIAVSADKVTRRVAHRGFTHAGIVYECQALVHEVMTLA